MPILLAQNAPSILSTVIVSADYTTAGEGIIYVNDTSSPRNITLSNNDKINGHFLYVKDTSGNASNNAITITPQSGTIDGVASIQITVNYGILRICTNGTNWFTLGGDAYFNDTNAKASASSPVTANKAVASDSGGALVASSTTDTELGYVHNVTSAIQTQLNGKHGLGRQATMISVFTNGNSYVGVTDTSSPRTITLSSADLARGSSSQAWPVAIKDESGGAGTNKITVDTEGSEKIDGVDSVDIIVNYGQLTVYSNGVNWFTI